MERASLVHPRFKQKEEGDFFFHGDVAVRSMEESESPLPASTYVRPYMHYLPHLNPSKKKEEKKAKLFESI